MLNLIAGVVGLGGAPGWSIASGSIGGWVGCIRVDWAIVVSSRAGIGGGLPGAVVGWEFRVGVDPPFSDPDDAVVVDFPSAGIVEGKVESGCAVVANRDEAPVFIGSVWVGASVMSVGSEEFSGNGDVVALVVLFVVGLPGGCVGAGFGSEARSEVNPAGVEQAGR